MSSPKANDRYYRRLEVRPDASQAEIVGAYRRLAQGAHPDTHPDDPEAPQRFREITEAYEVLTDPARRSRDDDPARGGARLTRFVVPGKTDPNRSASVGRTDPPLVLGGHAHVEGRPLRAGPVRIEPCRQTPASDRAEGELFRLFSDLLECLWRF